MKKKIIQQAIQTDKVRNSLIGASYYLDLLMNGEDYGKLNLAQKELIHRAKDSIDTANFRLDDIFGNIDMKIAGIAVNEKGREEEKL
jgi:hypothetical protein